MLEYSMKFRNTTVHGNAAAHSRLPLPVEPAYDTPPQLVLLADHMADSPVTAAHFHPWTRKDPD